MYAPEISAQRRRSVSGDGEVGQEDKMTRDKVDKVDKVTVRGLRLGSGN